ncbi:hypothetical protein [Flavobacterium sp. Root186]|uniref:hypothetical protein n=1 Tax=Flavobacterium sp. Root186 TaxID=1736485 RepID=UPI0006FDD108|nr:hypothetical protein [Flavobacterium sp. Root186]KRB56717.1 hypothetical protein ASD98_08480 [Flavobacterium sp. Root186]
MGKIKLIIILIIFMLISCNNKNSHTEEEYFQNGKLKSVFYYDDLNNQVKSQEYFETGKLKEATSFKKNRQSVSFFYNEQGNLIGKKYRIDSINTIQYEYHKNKKIKAFGPLYNNNKNGWWKIYNDKGQLIQKDEIFTIEGKEVLNQRIKYDLDGREIKLQSDTFTIKLADTLNIGRSIGSIKCKPTFSKDSKYAVYVGQGINPDFSNLNTVKLDTFYSTNKDDIWFGIQNFWKEKHKRLSRRNAL